MVVLLEEKSTGAPPIVRAAIIAFGFVFIHPFLYGNGRILRFLIHDKLTYDGIAGQGLVIPFSTHMLQHISLYDMELVYYSKPLMQRYDELKKELQRLSDMPDKPLSNVIMYLHQNKGIFPN
jgi:hypothetical protein